jgi:hypothetical protein
LISVGAKVTAFGATGFITILFNTTVSTPSTVAATGTTITPVNPSTGVTEIPVAVTLILTRDFSSSSMLLESEKFLADIFRFTVCEELMPSVLTLIIEPDF